MGLIYKFMFFKARCKYGWTFELLKTGGGGGGKFKKRKINPLNDILAFKWRIHSGKYIFLHKLDFKWKYIVHVSLNDFAYMCGKNSPKLLWLIKEQFDYFWKLSIISICMVTIDLFTVYCLNMYLSIIVVTTPKWDFAKM